MLPGAHFCIPLAVGGLLNLKSVHQDRQFLFNRTTLLYSSIFGILPDLVNPHFSLAARHQSWSHTLWFALGIAVVIYTFRLLTHKLTVQQAHLFVLAVILHLIGDAVAGGIFPLGTAGPQLGAYYLKPIYWPAADVATYFLAYLFNWAAGQRYRLLRVPSRLTLADHQLPTMQ